ncbi:YgfZ/GcvT domain-containing protein [Mumia zhuanghuii]|uniref:Folate-binding protein YgfZ n=1 Tax=Mumia zhuanghuii TaxID=2585211 RepID=A0A5C4MHR3_9ACTN|nr:folate-binding protein YgfZ [Mumia zhuanghuii]TNC37486.1 folate-binding protein YgfZ [Mumia zhuanghuii]TNC44187.1 folate-binding protein YgfZ [Mumia zhuanghuii]
MSDLEAPTYRSPLLDLPGAVEGEGVDRGVAAHYGAISPEQRALEAGEAFVDLSHRDVVTITGPDRLGWLHSLTTQAFEGLAPGTPTQGLVLSPQGRVEHAFHGVDDGEAFVAHTEPGQGAALASYLDSMRFMMRVEVTLESQTRAVLGLPGLRFVVIPRSELTSAPDSYGTPVGTWAWEALRIAAGVPRLGLDTDDKSIPNEYGWQYDASTGTSELMRAVHLAKGCYRGQETVARIHNLGRPPRRAVLLHLDGSAEHLPAHGSEVVLDGRRVGFVGSTARHHELGPIALAVVKRSVPLEATLLADGVAAAQEALVDPEVGLHVRPTL